MSPFARIAVLALALGAGAGCNSPTIPIPPPDPQAMTFSDLDPVAGNFRFSYDPEPLYADAVVYIFNRDQGVGLIVTAESDGSVPPTQPIPGVVDEDVVITFELEGQLATTCVELRAGPSDIGQRCP